MSKTPQEAYDTSFSTLFIENIESSGLHLVYLAL